MEKGIAELNLEIQMLKENMAKTEKGQENNKEMLLDIKSDVKVIKETLMATKEQEELKNQILKKDIDGMKERVEKLESNQKWLVTSVIAEVLGIIFGIIMIFIEKGIN